MKLKIIPITITAALTAVILFGGWFAYRHYGLEKPLDKIANAIPGVEVADVAMTTNLVKINVQLAPDANLSEVYRLVERDGANEIGGKKLELKATSNENERLQDAWSSSLFDVAEAMENRKYSAVKVAMDKLTKEFPGVIVNTDMDDNNVYVSMQDGEYSKFVVLPRQPATLGVWSNA